MTTKTDEQEHEAFEAWLLTLGLHLGNHERQLMLFAYRAGRAALQLQDREDVLRDALEHYADSNNWEKDEFGRSRVWREPGSATPEAYDGFELAFAALKEAK